MQLDEATFAIADQFAMGDDLIVAPVVEKGARARDVYLTRGTWRDAFEQVWGFSAFFSSFPLRQMKHRMTT